MKIGVENKRNVVILSVLGLGALYGIYSNFADSSSTPSPKAPVAAVEQQPTIGAPAGDSDQPAPPRVRARNEEWHPVVHPKSKEEQVDPGKVDPYIHLELLAKVQAAKPAGGDRNLFEFGVPPKGAGPLALAGNEPTIKGPGPMGPTELPPPPPPPPPPGEKPLPPLNTKYYGFATPSHSGRRRGFFMMEGDDILIKAEGEMLIGHYKIVKLDAGSVVVQDTDSKRTKTLPMEQDATE